jgi:hypothetical protein
MQLLRQRVRAVEGHIGSGGEEPHPGTPGGEAEVDADTYSMRLAFVAKQLGKMANGERVAAATVRESTLAARVPAWGCCWARVRGSPVVLDARDSAFAAGTGVYCGLCLCA